MVRIHPRAATRLLFLAGLLIATFAEAAPVAMVTGVTVSGAKVKRQAEVLDLVVGMEVEPGDELRFEGSGSATVSLLYADGAMLRQDVAGDRPFTVPETASVQAPSLLTRLGAGFRGLFADRSDTKSQETGSMNLGMAYARLPAREEPERKKESSESNLSSSEEAVEAAMPAKPGTPPSDIEEGGSAGETQQQVPAIDEADGGSSDPSLSPADKDVEARPLAVKFAGSANELRTPGPRAVAAPPPTRAGEVVAPPPMQDFRARRTAEPLKEATEGNCMLAMFQRQGTTPVAWTEGAEYERTWSIVGQRAAEPWTGHHELTPGTEYALQVSQVGNPAVGETLRVTLAGSAEAAKLESLAGELEGQPADELYALGLQLLEHGYLVMARRCFELTLARFEESKLPEAALAPVRRQLEAIQLLIGKADAGGARD